MRLCGFSNHFWLLSPCTGQVLHALLTRPPLTSYILQPKSHSIWSPFDLHVLGTPPAFILSQDQTLWKNVFNRTGNIGPLNTRFWCSRQHRHFCCLSLVFYCRFCNRSFKFAFASYYNRKLLTTLCKELFENRMCFTVQLSRFSVVLFSCSLATARLD